MRIRGFLRRAAGDNSGVTSIEYAVIAVLISTAIVSSVPLIGTELISTFSDVVNGFRTAN